MTRLELASKLPSEYMKPLTVLSWWPPAFEALDNPAIDLSLMIDGMQDRRDIVDRVELLNGNLAGFRVHCDLRNTRGKNPLGRGF